MKCFVGYYIAAFSSAISHNHNCLVFFIIVVSSTTIKECNEASFEEVKMVSLPCRINIIKTNSQRLLYIYWDLYLTVRLKMCGHVVQVLFQG